MNTSLFSRLNLFFRNHPAWRWITAILIILFSSYTILVPIIARWQIEKWMKEKGEEKVKVERVTFNPFTMRLRVHSLFAEGFQKEKIIWKRMAFEFDVWPLYKKRIAISDLVLHDALITVGKNSGGNWVVGGIPLRSGTRKDNRSKEKQGWKFDVSKIKLINVQIRYRGPNIENRDTLNDIFVLQLVNGTIGNITAGHMAMGIRTTRLKGIKLFVPTGSTGAENARPPAVQAGAFTIDDLSIIGKNRGLIVNSVVIQDLNASVVRYEDGTFSITKRFPDKNKGDTFEQTESKPPIVSIKKLTIEGKSQAELMDLSIEPQVTIQTTDLRFTLSGLNSNKEKAPGTYSLTATIRPKAILKANGTIGQIFPKPDLTVESKIENFNLQQLSSYMVNLFGYEIDSGRLDGTTNGNVRNGQLDIVSKVKVHNLEITADPEQSAYDKYKNAFVGMSLESAVSVITDKNGDVNLNIPVNGNLSDPKFNFTDVLRAAIVNSISGGLNAVINDSLN